jgi:proteic killer suppression protein
VIRSFRDPRAEKILAGVTPGKGFPPDLLKAARRKLVMLDQAASLEDCRVPPGNRLEALSGDRAGRYSIRINDQFRICFTWNDGAHDVEIVDYH